MTVFWLLFFVTLSPQKNGKTCFVWELLAIRFLCRACNKATRSHSSTVSSRSTAIATGASPVVKKQPQQSHNKHPRSPKKIGGASGHLVLLQISDLFGMLVGQDENSDRTSGDGVTKINFQVKHPSVGRDVESATP